MDGNSGTRPGSGGDTAWVSGGLPAFWPVGACAATDPQLKEITSHRKTKKQRAVLLPLRHWAGSRDPSGSSSTFSKCHGMFVWIVKIPQRPLIGTKNA